MRCNNLPCLNPHSQVSYFQLPDLIVALTARVDDLNLQLVAVIEKQIKLFAETHEEVIKYEKEKLTMMQEQGQMSAQQHKELISVLSMAKNRASAPDFPVPAPTALPVGEIEEGEEVDVEEVEEIEEEGVQGDDEGDIV